MATVPARAGTPLDARVFPPYKIATLVRACGEEGLRVDAVLAGTGLDAAALDDPDTRTSIAQFVDACRNALRLEASAALPFRMGGSIRASSYGLYGFAMLTARTARDAFRFAQRFHGLATPVFRLRLVDAPGEAGWDLEDALGLDAADPLHRFLVELQLSLHVSLARDVWPSGARASAIEVRHARPAHAALYVEHLGRLPRFGAPRDAIRLDAALLDAPMPLANPLTESMVRRMCEALLEHDGGAGGLARAVSERLAARPGRFPDTDALAADLGLAPRTLRRRLADEGTSYQRILDAVRERLAKDYLAGTRLAAEDIAEALGFGDSAAFRKAFRKWTGTSPGAWRRDAAG